MTRDGLGEVRFSGKGWQKVKRGLTIDIDLARLIPAIPAVIRDGAYQGRFPVGGRTDGIVAFHHINADVALGARVLNIGVSIGEDDRGNLFYNLNKDPAALLAKRKRPNGDRGKALGVGPSSGEPLDQSIGEDASQINIDILSARPAAARSARGTFTPSTGTITLLEGADLSTYLHDSGHFFLEVMADLAGQDDAPAGIVDDISCISAGQTPSLSIRLQSCSIGRQILPFDIYREIREEARGPRLPNEARAL